MSEVKYVKEPGFVRDLCILFVLYFNRDEVCSSSVNPVDAEADGVFFDGILDRMGPVPEDLRVFFHTKDGGSSISSNWLRDLLDSVLAGNWTEAFRSFATEGGMVRNVAEYYLGSAAGELAVDGPALLPTMGRLVRDSEYSATLKNCLYAFFLDPASVIRTLCDEMEKKALLLEEIYRENADAIREVRDRNGWDQLIKADLRRGESRIDLASYDEILLSVCPVHRNGLSVFTSGKTALVVMGTNYEAVLEALKAETASADLAQIGVALSEKNRIRVLELIRERGEITVAELQKELNCSHTNAYYHISLLMKAGLLTFQNRGRTVCYRIDRPGILAASAALRRFS